MTSERTVAFGQGRDCFPDRGTHREIQHVPQNRIAFGAWGVRQTGSLPSPAEDEDENAKRQRIEDRNINHGDTVRVQRRRTGSYTSVFVFAFNEFHQPRLRQRPTVSQNAVDLARILIASYRLNAMTCTRTIVRLGWSSRWMLILSDGGARLVFFFFRRRDTWLCCSVTMQSLFTFAGLASDISVESSITAVLRAPGPRVPGTIQINITRRHRESGWWVLTPRERFDAILLQPSVMTTS